MIFKACMPLSVLVPSVKKYVTDFSMRHTDGLLDEATGKQASHKACLVEKGSGYGRAVPQHARVC